MATTPNFSWPTPDNTDLVKNGALAIRTLGDAIDASLVDLEGGTTGQVLSKTSNTDMDFTWVTTDDANAIQNAIVDAKGDLIGATAADTPARLAVGANGTMLVANSAESTGLKWTTATDQFPWTAYTPVLTNITIGNGTVVGRYQQIGKTVTVFFKLTFGSTTAFPGGVPNFSLPFTAARELGRVVNTNLQDAGTADLPGLSYASQTGVFIGVQNVSATYPTILDVSATVPFTWTTSDTVTCQLTYEAV
jgi:hypothetical protein